MSHILGEGYGSCHNWERGHTAQVGSGWGTKQTAYRCINCKAVFNHFYDNVPDIFEAMENQLVEDQCPAVEVKI